VVDQVRSGVGHDVRLFLHLGPAVDVELKGALADLLWDGRDGARHRASLELPAALSWSEHNGETSPVLGWHSPRFGARLPISTLVGVGAGSDTRLVTSLTFQPDAGRQ